MNSRSSSWMAWLSATLVVGGMTSFAQSPPNSDGIAAPAPAAVSTAPAATDTTAAVQEPVSAEKAQPGSVAEDKQTGLLQKRDPFWPVGYVSQRIPPPPPAEGKTELTQAVAVATVSQNWARALERLRVQGIVGGRNGKFFATVNNKVVEQGDEVSVSFEGSTYRWRISSIDAKGIVTEPIITRAER